jgi:enamine deaminase RidA (YjgF/YER057c/UK114 family)
LATAINQSLALTSRAEALTRLAGGSVREVVRLTCYLSDRSVYPAYAKVKASVFRPDVQTPPAGTAVVVTELLDSGFLLEAEATPSFLSILRRYQHDN